MKVIIVEDELPASRKLESLLLKADPKVVIQGPFQSVKESVSWISSNPDIDLGFFDIQLSDDVSFSIFEQCTINFPVVFITAYDDYLLKAFEYNSLHYLLKPVSAEKIQKTLMKLKHLEEHFISTGVREAVAAVKNKDRYKSRIIVHRGVEYIPLDTTDVAYIFSQRKVCFAKSMNNNLFMLDETLSELEPVLDPEVFFRANRQYIINIKSLTSFKSIEHGKVKLELKPVPAEVVTISRENSGAFRKWIEK